MTTKTKKVSTSETGHAKNIANFGTAIQILQEMAGLYNPSNPQIAIANLQTVKQNLEQSITNLNTRFPIYKNAVASRENAIEPVGKLMTRISNFVNQQLFLQQKKKPSPHKLKKLEAM